MFKPIRHLAATILLMAPTAVSAQQTIIKKITQSELLRVMGAQGYAVKAQGEQRVVWMRDGLGATIMLEDDRGSIQFYTFANGVKNSKDKTNAWNREKRYSKSYVDREGDVCLELDLDLAGGVTTDRLIDYLSTCRVSWDAWIKSMGDD